MQQYGIQSTDWGVERQHEVRCEKNDLTTGTARSFWRSSTHTEETAGEARGYLWTSEVSGRDDGRKQEEKCSTSSPSLPVLSRSLPGATKDDNNNPSNIPTEKC